MWVATQQQALQWQQINLKSIPILLSMKMINSYMCMLYVCAMYWRERQRVDAKVQITLTSTIALHCICMYK